MVMIIDYSDISYITHSLNSKQASIVTEKGQHFLRCQ